MVAARGRKRAEDTTPNRARDIQRAFRARRAAHLEALEARIAELENENIYFRQLLNLPPAQRPELGKGPTGRGLAKSRSRLSTENFRAASSPDPSSDTPTTPGTDPNELPKAGAFEDGSHLALDMNTIHYLSEIPKLEYHPGTPTQFGHFGELAVPNPDDTDVSNGRLVPAFDGVPGQQGFIDRNHTLQQVSCANDIRWVANPMVSEDMDDTPVQGRPFSYPQDGMITRSLSPQLRPASHRRSNTDPQCTAQTISLINSCHRHNVADFGQSPSPPPLSIAYSGMHNKSMALLG